MQREQTALRVVKANHGERDGRVRMMFGRYTDGSGVEVEVVARTVGVLVTDGGRGIRCGSQGYPLTDRERHLVRTLTEDFGLKLNGDAVTIVVAEVSDIEGKRDCVALVSTIIEGELSRLRSYGREAA